MKFEFNLKDIALGAVAIAIALPVVLAASIYWGWAASILWGWFIVPMFNAPELGALQMAAIMIVLGAMRSKTNFKDEVLNRNATLVTILIGPLISLAWGWALKAMM